MWTSSQNLHRKETDTESIALIGWLRSSSNDSSVVQKSMIQSLQFYRRREPQKLVFFSKPLLPGIIECNPFFSAHAQFIFNVVPFCCLCTISWTVAYPPLFYYPLPDNLFGRFIDIFRIRSRWVRSQHNKLTRKRFSKCIVESFYVPPVKVFQWSNRERQIRVIEFTVKWKCMSSCGMRWWLLNGTQRFIEMREFIEIRTSDL